MTTERLYQMCSRCILDTEDYPEIFFDQNGVCNVCQTFDDLKARTVFTGEEGSRRLNNLISDIQRIGKGKDYDCMLAISGGVDSAYLAYMAKDWGLRPLILHIDNGWNSELAVKNIESIVNSLGFDLFTFVIDWQELRDLQLAYLKSSVIDLDVPSEVAVEAAFYKYARKFKVKHILTGHNTLTEGWLPPNFTSPFKLDTRNLRAIHKKFGTIKLKKYKPVGYFRTWYYRKLLGLQYVSPLNLIPYSKAEAKNLLSQKFGWRDYGGKHYENLFTRFYQGYILPEKYKIDKRKSHYSTLICSNELTKEEALILMQRPPYENPQQLLDDKIFFLKKLGITEEDFKKIMKEPIHQHTDYPSYIGIYNKFRPIIRPFKWILKPDPN